MFEINNLNLFYGDKQALEDINLKIEDKQITALIGPSGCGKSTLLRCLNKMNDLNPNCRIEGEIKYRDQNITDKKYNAINLRLKVGMVFQKPAVFPMSIYDNIAYGPRAHGIKGKKELDAIVESTLKQAALYDEVKDRLKESAQSLSGGQQQRLCIARALALKPDCLLMDEPTSALDPIATLRIEELILELKKDYTIIIVTHNMQQATRISDKCAFFFQGKLIEYNDTNILFTKPKESKTEDYITGKFG